MYVRNFDIIHIRTNVLKMKSSLFTFLTIIQCSSVYDYGDFFIFIFIF